MASFNMTCPFCEGVLQVQDEWGNMETTCPLCGGTIVVPGRGVADNSGISNLPPQTEPDNERDAYTAPLSNISVVWESLKPILSFLGVSAFVILGIIAACDSDTSADVAMRGAKNEMKNFLTGFYECPISDVEVDFDDSGSGSVIRGKVSFTRNGQSFERPVKVSYNTVGDEVRYWYGFDFSYSEHNDFLRQDAEFFFNSLKKDNYDLSNYTFAGVESAYSGVARCRLRYRDGSTELVEISVSEVGDEIVWNLKSVY